MEFEWDEEKELKNIDKHGISFSRAATIFSGPVVSCIDSRKDYGEVRMQSIGTVDDEVVILVIHTDRYNIIRIISARAANKKERERYYGAIQKRQ